MQNGTNLALNVKKMIFDKPIIIDTYQHYAALTGCTVAALSIDGRLKDGYTIIDNGLYIVLYNDEIQNQEHLNWTLAHEIGHIYLGHKTDGKVEEVEAHWFAAELLAPEALIRNMLTYEGVSLSAVKLQQIFELSFSAATKRYTTIARKSVWNLYLYNELSEKYHGSIVALRRNRVSIREMLEALNI